MFSFGLPPDAVAWMVLALGLLVLVVPRRWTQRFTPRPTVICLSLAATLLSWGYFEHYLGGEPRVIDATAYLLEARSFAQGGFSFEVPSPTASFRGRFLVTTTDNDHALAVIFPPGYPALLSLGALVGKPEWVGPLLAALLVVATFAFARSATGSPQIGMLAAVLSTTNACLRYHTAETMSHGWAALLGTLALWAAVELLRTPSSSRRWAALLGASLGLLVATRQLTGILFAVACLLPLGLRALGQGPPPKFPQTRRDERQPRPIPKSHAGNPLGSPLVIGVLASLPGILLLLAHHWIITGSLFESPQTRYYDLADGPGRCFGWGLGRGCGYEHAEVVQQQGGHGLTWTWAFWNTAHRLHWHALDIVNFEPLVLLGLWTAWRVRRQSSFWPPLCSILLVVVGYAFFYFNGSYPGGGARFFSELLPTWHVLVATGIAHFRVQRAALFCSLFGFAVHGAYSHRVLLSDHFGPRLGHLASLPPQGQLPLPAAAALDDVSPGARPSRDRTFVFFSEAHTFNLASLRSEAFRAARNTQDSRPWLLTDRGASQSFLFDSDPEHSALRPFAPERPQRIVLESEFDYPPLSAHNLWTHPSSVALPCVSGGRALEVHAEGPGAILELELVAPDALPREVVVFWVHAHRECRRTRVPTRSQGERLPLSLDRFPGISHLDRVEWVP